MKKAENIIVGISIGDLNGIGSEVVLKTFDDSRMLELCTPVIFANVKVMSFIKKTLELEIPLHGIDQIDQIVPGKVNVLNIWREGVDLNFGANDPIIGKYAIKSFVAATKALKENQIDVFRGDENDLLDRHYQCALKYEATTVAKIPSDCPLIDARIMDRVFEFFLENN